MKLLISGLLAFIVPHVIPFFPDSRSTLRKQLTPQGYKAIFSLLSAAGLVMVVLGLKEVHYIHLYTPPAWGHWLTALLMFPAFYCVMSNPVFSVPTSAQFLTAHPLSWGIIFWSVGHLLSNGDVAHVLLFGVFLIYSVLNIISGNQRGQTPRRQSRPPLHQEAVFLVLVVLVYGAVYWGHGYISGVEL